MLLCHNLYIVKQATSVRTRTSGRLTISFAESRPGFHSISVITLDRARFVLTAAYKPLSLTSRDWQVAGAVYAHTAIPSDVEQPVNFNKSSNHMITKSGHESNNVCLCGNLQRMAMVG